MDSNIIKNSGEVFVAEKYKLGGQIRDASVSATANIAEGLDGFIIRTEYSSTEFPAPRFMS